MMKNLKRRLKNSRPGRLRLERLESRVPLAADFGLLEFGHQTERPFFEAGWFSADEVIAQELVINEHAAFNSVEPLYDRGQSFNLSYVDPFFGQIESQLSGWDSPPGIFDEFYGFDIRDFDASDQFSSDGFYTIETVNLDDVVFTEPVATSFPSSNVGSDFFGLGSIAFAIDFSEFQHALPINETIVFDVIPKANESLAQPVLEIAPGQISGASIAEGELLARATTEPVVASISNPDRIPNESVSSRVILPDFGEAAGIDTASRTIDAGIVRENAQSFQSTVAAESVQSQLGTQDESPLSVPAYDGYLQANSERTALYSLESSSHWQPKLKLQPRATDQQPKTNYGLVPTDDFAESGFSPTQPDASPEMSEGLRTFGLEIYQSTQSQRSQQRAFSAVSQSRFRDSTPGSFYADLAEYGLYLPTLNATSFELFAGEPIGPLHGVDTFNIFQNIVGEAPVIIDDFLASHNYAMFLAPIRFSTTMQVAVGIGTVGAVVLFAYRRDSEKMRRDHRDWLIAGHETFSTNEDVLNDTRPIVFRFGT